MDRASRNILMHYAQMMRINMTESEKRLWYSFLREYPIAFTSQKVVGPYIVDFYCKKVRLSIELDGSQHYEAAHQYYDEIRTIYLDMLGIKELRFPNTYVWDNFDGVCETIHREVQSRRNDIHTLSLSLLTDKR